MDIREHYKSLMSEEEDLMILNLLLDASGAQYNLGLEKFSKKISSHVGAADSKRLLKEFIPILISQNAFIHQNGEFLTPTEVIEMLDSVLYLEILFEESLKKAGRRGFFLSNFKSVRPEWTYFSYEFLLSKTMGHNVRDLLALFVGVGSYDLGIISKWDKLERVKVFIVLSRKQQIGIFQDGSFIGFKSYKKINEVEDLLQLIFDEIDLLTRYFKNEDVYFELYGKVDGIKILPPLIKAKEIPRPINKAQSLLEKHLITLKIKKLPESKKELKKIFYQLALTTHPDKFAHVDKGTRTEFAIVNKFREVYEAYEFIEKELDKV